MPFISLRGTFHPLNTSSDYILLDRNDPGRQALLFPLLLARVAKKPKRLWAIKGVVIRDMI